MPGREGREPGPYWEERKWLGQQIGHLEIESFLGRGGTAMVFQVLDRETGLTRALKMTATQPTEGELHRFKREFRVMSRLAHPNVITVFRYGIYETRPFFMMELIEGRDLRSYLRVTADKPGYFQRVAEVLVQVVRALAYIHDRHIVHRDLKPGNILVTHVGLVKVMDFGIAFEIDVRAPVSRSTKLMGTLAYVSPEQATGRKVDARSDLYSLGIILYELIAGAKPFKGTTVSQMVYKHLHEVPKNPREQNPRIPPQLSDLALSLLAKRPHERPQSAQEVLVALETFIAGGQAPDSASLVPDIAPEKLPINEPRFVGRSRLMAALKGRFESLKAGKGGVALIAGDTGQGKSRLIEEVCRAESLETAFVFSGRCQAQATSSYHGFRDIIRAVVRLQADSAQGLDAALTPPQISLLVAAFPDLRRILGPQVKLEPSHHDDVPDWLSLFTAVRAIFERLTEQGPVVLTFDDLDQADEASLALLQALLRTLVAGGRTRRLFVLGTIRPETLALIAQSRSSSKSLRIALSGLALSSAPGDTGRHVSSSDPWRSTSSATLIGGVVERLHAILDMVGYHEPPLIWLLSPLSVGRVEEMIRSMLGHTDDPVGLAEYLHQQSDGNPSLVEAILRALVEQGILVRREHSTTGCEWSVRRERMDAQMTTLALPAGLHGALRKRLSLLEPRDLALLQLAAAFGEPFTYEMLYAVADLEEDPLLDFLDRMLKARMLSERTSSGRMIYDFEHGRARELIVGELPRQEQVLLHQRVGLKLAATGNEVLSALIGNHLYEGRLYDEALTYLVLAGERLVRQHLYRLAMKPLAQAEEILERYRVPLEGRDDSALKLRLDHALGMALRGVGRNDEAYEHLSQALTAVQSREDFEVEAEVRTSLGHVLFEQGEYRKSREHYEEAVARLRAGGLAYRMGSSILGLGRILTLQGPLKQANSIYVEARDLALELQNKSCLAGAVLGLGESALFQGNLTDAFRRLEEALGMHRWLEDRPSVIRGLEGLGEARRITGQYDAALTVLDEAIQMAREYDLRTNRAALCVVLGETYLDLNAPTQAEGVLNEGMTLCSVHNLVFQRAALFRVWGALMERTGQMTAALDAYRQGLKLSQGISAHILTHRLLAQVARVQLANKDIGAARRLAEKAVSELKRCGAMYACVEAAMVSTQVHLAERDEKAAHVLLNETIARASEMDARDLAFRALLTRFMMPVSTEGYSLNIGLQRAAGILQCLLEGAGSRWRAKLLDREDVATFMKAHPVVVPEDNEEREETKTSDT